MVKPALWLMKTSIWHHIGCECKCEGDHSVSIIYSELHKKIVIRIVDLIKGIPLVVNLEESCDNTDGGYLQDEVKASRATFNRTPNYAGMKFPIPVFCTIVRNSSTTVFVCLYSWAYSWLMSQSAEFALGFY